MRSRAVFLNVRAKARVAAGAALLDELTPGWWRKVRSKTLDIASTQYCVTGQLFGSYARGLEALHLDNEQAPEYGFERGDDGYNYPLLNTAWRDQIQLRRSGHKMGRQR